MQHPDEVYCGSFSSDGRYALTGCRGKLSAGVYVWELSTGKRIAPRQRFPSSVATIAVAPDGKRAFACHGDTMVILPLDELLSPPSQPTEYFALLGEVSAAYRIELGDLSGLTLDQWKEKWEQLRAVSSASYRAEALARCGAQRQKAGQLLESRRGTEAVAAWREALGEAERFPVDQQSQAIRAELCEEIRTALEGLLAENDQRADSELLEITQLLSEVLVQSRPQPLWEVLVPEKMESSGAATLTRLPDNSVLAGGRTPTLDSYTIQARAPAKEIRALRLEVLPHPNLPANGPGRASQGNFCLTEISMHLVPADGKGPGQPLAFTRAAASYRREADNLTTSRDGPHGAIDGDQSTKWDIWPQANHLHTAIFETRQAAGNSSQDLLVVQLDFRDRRSLGHGLGRFRLSATSQLNCARDENLIALARSAGHWTRLATAYVVRGDFERARAASQKAVAGPNSSTHDHLLACLIHEHLGQTVLADKDLDEAMQRVPDKAAVHGVADRLLMELAVDAISPRIAREPKDARLLMTRFRWLAVLGLPARALSDLDRARAVKSGETLTVNYYAPLHELAGAAVGRRDWPTVVRIHNELAALNPSDSWVRYRLATVQAYLGNKDEYRKVCNELLKKFEKNADLAVSEQIAKACQLIPDVVRDREGIARNAQAARTDPRNNLRGFYFLTTALTEYRAGRWAAAVEWCNKASEEKTWVEVAPAAGYVLAMTRFRQGEVAAARKMIADLSATPGLDGSWITRDNWQDWLIIFILRREAEQLISPELAPRPREVK